MSWRHLGGENDPVPAHTGPKGVDRGRRIGIVVRTVLFRNVITGLDRVPADGPLLVVANHTAFIDGAVLFGCLPRRVSFLVKAEAIKGALGWLLTNVGQYALERDKPDREPLLAALAQLKAGGAVGVFPEGTRGAGAVENVFNGAGWLAVRSGATVLPIAIRGTARPAGSRRRFRPYVHVQVGEPFEVPPGAGRKAVTAATAVIQEKLAAEVVALDSVLAERATPTGGRAADRHWKSAPKGADEGQSGDRA